MKVLMLSTDIKILDKESAVASRLIEYSKGVTELHVIVFTEVDPKIGNLPAPRLRGQEAGRVSDFKLASNVYAYPTNSRSRLRCLSDGFGISRPLFANWQLDKSKVVVTCQDGFTGVLGMFLALMYLVGLELQVHTDFLASEFRGSHAMYLQKLSYRVAVHIADVVRVVSGRIKRSLVGRLKVVESKIKVLPIFVNKLDDDNVEASRVKEDSNWDHLILVASRFTPEKNILLAVDAFASVVRRFPKAGLLIIGEGPQKNAIEDKISKLNLHKSVTILPWQNDLTPYYREADIFLLTSNFEGYGRTLIEAAMVGTPIVSTDVGLIGDILNPHNVLIAPVRDETKLSEHIAFLLQNPRARVMMQSRLKEAVATLPSKEDYLASIVTLWQGIAKPISRDWISKSLMLIKYVISGGTAATVNIGLLYVFTDIVGLWYVFSAVLSFCVSFGVSFGLQKFWTFNDGSREDIHKQMGLYLVVTLLNLGLNTLFIYIMVEYLLIWYMLAAIIAGALIAVESFVVYRRFIFDRAKH